MSDSDAELSNLNSSFDANKNVSSNSRNKKRKITDTDLDGIASEVEDESSRQHKGAGKKTVEYEESLLRCIIDPEKIEDSLDDVVIGNEIKSKLMALISLPKLRISGASGQLVRQLRRSSKGVLFYGPPGTGKTHLCRAIAKESGATLIAVNPSDIQGSRVGESEENVKALFSLARKRGPCIIFLDKTDVLLSRSQRTHILSELDGLLSRTSDDSPFVIAATNRLEDLDDAFLRRMPHQIPFALPSNAERIQILERLITQECITDRVDIPSIARETNGFSGLDLLNLCSEAALIWITQQTEKWMVEGMRQGPLKLELDQEHFDMAKERVGQSISRESLEGIEKFAESHNELKANSAEISSTKTPSNRGKSTRVAHFSICEDDTCSFPTTPHLVIDIDVVPLHRDNAVAISYVWGQFERERKPIGHHRRDGEEVSIELGSEWVLQDVVERLAELSEKKPLWMDQFCMPQKDEQVIAEALADIPTIFLTLDVVILMPGNLCGCIPQMINEISKITIDEHGSRDAAQVQECISRRKECLGWGVSSWVRRLWPRQELIFSRRARCVWASKEKRKCITQAGFQVPQDVPVFTMRMMDMFLTHSPMNKDFTFAVAHKTARLYKDQAEGVMMRDYAQYVLGSQENTKQNRCETESFFRFLLGEEACNGGPMVDLPEIVPFVLRLQLEMGINRDHFRVRREATRPRDYVISIWTPCPGYKIPSYFKFMEFPDLLQDAIDQLQKKHHMALATTAPRGLFDAPCQGSALWNPAEYLSDVVPTSDVDVYRTLACEGWAFDVFHEHMVPISILNTRKPGLSTQAFDYHALLKMWEVELENDGSSLEASNGAEITPRLVALLNGAMKSWDKRRKQALSAAVRFDCIQHWFTKPFTIENLRKDTINRRRLNRYESVKQYLDFFVDYGCDDDILDAYRQHLEPNINPSDLSKMHDAIYIIVAASLELDVEYCEKKGVKLMFHLGESNTVQLRVGFCSRDIEVGAKSDKGDCITISMAGRNYPSGTLLYEAFPIPHVDKGSDVEESSNTDDGSNVDRHLHIDSWSDIYPDVDVDEAPKADEGYEIKPYLVFAVWVPTESITSSEYTAQARPSERGTKDEMGGFLI